MNDTYQKKILIEELTKLYPYPESWFMKKPLSALLGMYMKARTKTKPEKKKVPKTETNYTEKPATRKYENGEWWILTEGHGWEIETN